MTEDRFFAVVAGLSLLVWLLGRGDLLRDRRQRRLAQTAAFGLVAAAMLYAGFRSLEYFLR